MKKKNTALSILNIAEVPVRSILLAIDLFFLSAHIFFLIYFWIKGVDVMFFFNIFSVTFYFVLGYVSFKHPGHILSYAMLVMLEVVTHASLAAITIGWSAGFPMFIVCCVPFPFFLNFRKMITPYLIELVLVADFLFVRLLTFGNDNPAGHMISEQTAERLFVFNTCISFLMITVFSTVYKLTKQLEQYKMKKKNETLNILVKIDPLSQLFNRRAMVDFLKKIESDTRSGRGSYVIVMGDLDGFKHINDTYGHSMGDSVITAVSKIMTEEVPSEGYVCRWGGEELLFAVPNSGCTQGAAIAERIRQRLGQQTFTAEDGRTFGVTITFGVCECDGSFSYERAVSCADQRLYYGKQHGKNTVISREQLPHDALQ